MTCCFLFQLLTSTRYWYFTATRSNWKKIVLMSYQFAKMSPINELIFLNRMILLLIVHWFLLLNTQWPQNSTQVPQYFVEFNKHQVNTWRFRFYVITHKLNFLRILIIFVFVFCICTKNSYYFNFLPTFLIILFHKNHTCACLLHEFFFFLIDDRFICTSGYMHFSLF